MLKKALVVGVTAASALTMLVSAHVVQAAPPANSDNVKICHRTHSVTNPYVLITVDQRSVGNANSKHGGGAHVDYATSLYPSKPNPNVYDPSKTYPANDKKWGDIVAFLDVSGNALTGSAANVAGLNNTGIGAEIFNGTGAYAGLCRAMNARDYYEVEKQAGVNPTDILKEMDELDSPEFASTLAACGGSFVGCDPVNLGTPVLVLTTTTTTVPTTKSTLPAGTTLAAGKGALQVKIWVDANRSGTQSSTEKSMKNVTVTIVGPNGVTKTAKTDADGNVLFLDLDPGSWSVASILTAQGFEKVHDSDGTVDWKTTLSVTEGSVSAASFAAADKATSTLPATGTPMSVWIALLGMGSLILGTLLRRRLHA